MYEDEPEDVYAAICRAIDSSDVELLEELFEEHRDGGYADEYLSLAIETANIDVINVITEYWPDHTDYVPEVLRKIPSSSHDEHVQVQIMENYLESLVSQHQEPSLTDIIDVVFYCCTEKKILLVESFINNFYLEENSLHPLIERVKATVDGWQHIAALLHDDFFYNSHFTIHNYRYPKTIAINIAETFLKLLLKGTSESMELAVEVFQVLFDKNVHKLFEFMKASKSILSIPLNKKVLFQFIYSSINDKTQQHIYEMIDFWLFFCKVSEEDEDEDEGEDKNDFLILSRQILNPFIQQPLWKIIPDPISDCPQTFTEQNGICSLKELARDVIRGKVFQNVSNVKEFFDRIKEFNLEPITECFMLYVPFDSWMNSLQEQNFSTPLPMAPNEPPTFDVSPISIAEKQKKTIYDPESRPMTVVKPRTFFNNIKPVGAMMGSNKKPAVKRPAEEGPSTGHNRSELDIFNLNPLDMTHNTGFDSDDSSVFEVKVVSTKKQKRN